MYTNFGYILSIHSQDMERNPNSDVNQEPLLCCEFAKMTMYNYNIDLVNDIAYTKVVLNLSICAQDIEKKI